MKSGLGSQIGQIPGLFLSLPPHRGRDPLGAAGNLISARKKSRSPCRIVPSTLHRGRHSPFMAGKIPRTARFPFPLSPSRARRLGPNRLSEIRTILRDPTRWPTKLSITLFKIEGTLPPKPASRCHRCGRPGIPMPRAREWSWVSR